MKKFALLIDIFFLGRNLLSREKNHLPEKIVFPRLPFSIENQKIYLSNGKDCLNRRKKQKSKLSYKDL